MEAVTGNNNSKWWVWRKTLDCCELVVVVVVVVVGEKVVVAPGAAAAAVVQRVLLAECKTQGHRGRLSRQASRRHRGWHCCPKTPSEGGREGNLTTIALTAAANRCCAYHCPFNHIAALRSMHHCNLQWSAMQCNAVQSMQCNAEQCATGCYQRLSTALIIMCPLTHSLHCLTLQLLHCNPDLLIQHKILLILIATLNIYVMLWPIIVLH